MELSNAAGPAQPKVFYSVQALRGISALLVVLFHLSMRELQDWPKATFHLMQPFNYFGFSGVEIFFVISGFIITTSTISKFGKKGSVLDYALKRFYRIYPVYWITSGLMIGTFLLNRQHDWRSWMNALFFLPGFREQINPVSWSLYYEIVFYTVFAGLMLFSARWLPLILSVWASLIALHQVNPSAIAPDWLYTPIVFNAFNFAFLFGVSIALMVRKKMIVQPMLCLAAGIGWLSLGSILNAMGLIERLDMQPNCLLFAELSAALIVYGAIGLEYQGRLKMPAWLLFAGDASYSLYLVHYMIILWLKPTYLTFADAPTSIMACWSLFVGALGVASGLLCFRFIERPLLELCMSRMPKFNAVPATLPAAVTSFPPAEGALVVSGSGRQD